MERRRAGVCRLRLVERLCAAHGEPTVGGVNAHDGNRTRDDSMRDARRRVWTKADPRPSRSLFLRARLADDAVPHGARFRDDTRDEGAQAMASIRGTRRAGVIASVRYLSLTNAPSAGSRQRRKLERYRWVWDECKALLAYVAGCEAANSFDGLAVTHGVRGSPHVDSMDVAPQFACSLGDFRATDRGDGYGG